MMKEEDNVVQAKKSLKSHIKFLESLLSHINGSDIEMKGRAMWATWCIHRYLNDGLIKDIEASMLLQKGDLH